MGLITPEREAATREALLEQQDHKCADCGVALDGFVAYALPLADGRTVAVCSECGSRLNRLWRQAQRF